MRTLDDCSVVALDCAHAEGYIVQAAFSTVDSGACFPLFQSIGCHTFSFIGSAAGVVVPRNMHPVCLGLPLPILCSRLHLHCVRSGDGQMEIGTAISPAHSARIAYFNPIFSDEPLYFIVGIPG